MSTVTSIVNVGSLSSLYASIILGINNVGQLSGTSGDLSVESTTSGLFWSGSAPPIPPTPNIGWC